MLNRLQDVFKSFQQHEVRYLVIGGVASVLYGVPRATFDVDILIEPTIENAQRLLTALEEAGCETYFPQIFTNPADEVGWDTIMDAYQG